MIPEKAELAPSGQRPKQPWKRPISCNGGRPSQYKPEYCELLIEHMAGNEGIIAFARVVRVHPSTIYGWIREIPEFREAFGIGRGERAHIIEQKLYRAKSGPEVAAAIFQAKNVLPEEYREKVEIGRDGMTDDGPAALDEVIREAIADAMRQLGAQTVMAMRSLKVIDPGSEPIEGRSLEVAKSAEPAPVDLNSDTETELVWPGPQAHESESEPRL
jgi:hypothetical protein